MTELDEASQNRFNEQKKLAGELSTLEWMKDKWPVYSEWQTLQEKTKQDFYFPADGNIRLEHFINRLRERENELLQLQERKKALEEPTFSNDAILNKGEALEIESLLEMWPVYQERKAAFQELRYAERKQLEQVTLHFGDMVPSFNSDMDRQVEQIVQAMAEIDSDFQTEELTLTFFKKKKRRVCKRKLIA
ncbi:hypothetical protein [Listeria fleischmannii]|uniref:hypothetical protein n=1 Tax=Listeria fleischmannii TaxID=1069827 RepID=UPI0004ACF696|nr:hypothetical protein [Listeria fleischmannii]